MKRKAHEMNVVTSLFQRLGLHVIWACCFAPSLACLGGEPLPAVEQLIRELDGADPIDAILLLQEHKERAAPAIPALLKAVAKDPVKFGRPVANALATIGAEGIPHLWALFGHPERVVRLSAAEVISWRKLSSAENVPALIAALNDSESEVFVDAVGELTRLGPVARDAIPELGEKLRSAVCPARGMVATALAAIGPEALDPLVAAADHDLSEVRIPAYNALARLARQHPRAVKALMGGLRDRDREARHRAIFGLGDTGEKAVEALPSLLEMAGDPHEGTRDAVAFALPKLAPRNPRTVAVLIGLLNDRVAYVQDRALQGLSECDKNTAQAAVPEVLKCLRHPNEHIRLRALGTLRKIAPPSINVAEAIFPCLHDAYLSARSHAISCLAELGCRDERVYRALADCLDDPSEGIWKGSLRALGKLKGVPAEDVSRLLQAVKDPPRRERVLEFLESHARRGQAGDEP